MAYTVTLLSWVSIKYRGQLKTAGEYDHAVEAIKWGTDFLLKAHTKPDELYIQVCEPNWLGAQ
jgi:hypothetical protein